jgi:hypothetical protein
LVTPAAGVVWIAATRHILFGSYPHRAFKNAFTVSAVGVVAVKNFGLTGGKGSGRLDESSDCS